MKRVMMLLVLVFVVSFFAGVAFAGGGEACSAAPEAAVADASACSSPAAVCPKAKCPACDGALSSDYLTKTVGKFGRGLSNAAFGWVEIGIPIVDDYKKKTNFWTATDNAAWGVIHFFTRTAGGIVDVVTCWVPQIPGDKMYSDCPFGRVGLADK